MAFQFVPPFEEGNKQTNPETGVEYLFTGGAWRPLGPKIEDEFDTLDDRYVKRQDTTVLGEYYRLRGPNVAGDGTSTFQVIDEGEQKLYNVKTPESSNQGWAANVEYVNNTVSDYLPLTGGNMTGGITSKTAGTSTYALRITDSSASNTVFDLWCPSGPGSAIKYVGANDTKHWFQNYNASGAVDTTLKLGYQDYRLFGKTGITYKGSDAHRFQGTAHFGRGDKGNQFKISPNSNSTDYATNIYTLNNGPMRLRTSHTADEGDHKGSHIVLNPNDGNPQTKIFNVVADDDTCAVPKSYVDEKVASSGGGVPVGSIMIWMNSSAPAGWFKLQGGSFNVNTYPLLDAYLQNTEGYTSGRLPNWGGHYPGEWGDHLVAGLGTKKAQQTAKPSGGSPYSSSRFNNGEDKTANQAGGSSFAGTRKGQVSIDSGWDSVTRPKTVVVHYIIKHD